MHVDVFPKLAPEELVRRWQSLLQDPDAPERCELDEYGDVLVTPTPSFWHQHTTARIGDLLKAQLGGEVGSYALQLSIGVRMPDVCWAPNFLDLARLGSADPLDHMPPLCVEVVSAGNKRKDVAEKVPAYLAAGVQEVIVVGEGQTPRFFTQAGDSERSVFGVTISL
jgi:Uma2 family endonuclease